MAISVIPYLVIAQLKDVLNHLSAISITLSFRYFGEALVNVYYEVRWEKVIGEVLEQGYFSILE
jgi:hypothetical protein